MRPLSNMGRTVHPASARPATLRRVVPSNSILDLTDTRNTDHSSKSYKSRRDASGSGQALDSFEAHALDEAYAGNITPVEKCGSMMFANDSNGSFY